jgi:hypothetical protein
MEQLNWFHWQNTNLPNFGSMHTNSLFRKVPEKNYKISQFTRPTTA